MGNNLGPESWELIDKNRRYLSLKWLQIKETPCTINFFFNLFFFSTSSLSSLSLLRCHQTILHHTSKMVHVLPSLHPFLKFPFHLFPSISSLSSLPFLACRHQLILHSHISLINIYKRNIFTLLYFLSIFYFPWYPIFPPYLHYLPYHFILLLWNNNV